MHSDTLIQVDQAPVAITIVEPRKAFWELELGSLWEYRELLYFLVGGTSKSSTNKPHWEWHGRFCNPYWPHSYSVYFLGAWPGFLRTGFRIQCLSTWRWCRGSISPTH